MKEFTLETSIKGVRCSKCEAWIRPKKFYWRWEYRIRRGYISYINYCVECFEKIAKEEILNGYKEIHNLKQDIKRTKTLLYYPRLLPQPQYL